MCAAHLVSLPVLTASARIAVASCVQAMVQVEAAKVQEELAK